MNILCIGDVVGSPGREAVKKVLPDLKKEKKIHLCLANVENVAHGSGATEETLQELASSGVDVFTSGNHIWKTKDIVPKLNDKSYPLLRPANYPAGNPGRGADIFSSRLLKKALVMNLQGRVFMPEGLDNPFRGAEDILQQFKHETALNAIVVDFHAEATSEKHALRHFLDGKVSAIVGTHTHVQTNDEMITNQGTAYISDIGMTGVFNDSVIGIDKNASLNLFLLANAFPWELAKGEMLFQAVCIEIDDRSKKALHIEKIKQIVR